MKVFYSELAAWWPLLSPVEDYADEAAECLRVLRTAHPSAKTLLELGSGGGHNAWYLKARYDLTLSDLSQEMLDVSARLNPGCEHVLGDMRSLALDRAFDIVFVHDAVDYMTTEADLAAAIATSWRHLRPGGVVLFVPDALTERYEPGTECGGTDGPDGRGIRYLEWSYDPDPADTLGTTEYVFLTREADGTTRSHRETHTFGLFPTTTWTRLLERQGFSVETSEERTDDDRTPRLFFVGRRGE